MKNEEQQKNAEGEKDLAKNIQEKAFEGGQNAVTTYQTNLQAPQAPKMELPKGGGALRSIGEKFEANPVTGTANISVPIAMSPGRNGFQPELSLSYSSGGGNGIFGMGWGVGLGSISRKTQKGLPQYDDTNESDVFIFAGVEDLVPVLSNGEYADASGNYTIKRYQPRMEGSFLKIEQWKNSTGDIHWRVTDKNNVTSVLGESAEARVYDSEDDSRIYEWKIERKYDATGNCIQYEYFRENENGLIAEPADYNRIANATAYNQLYPRAIKYGNTEMYGSANWNTNNWHFEVIFNYGEDETTYPDSVTNANINWTKRQDPFSNFRPGFEIRTYRLCQKINMYHRFDTLNGGTPLLVKSTEITYNENKIGAQIDAVSHKGYDETDEKAFPPISFTYTQAIPNQTVYTLKEEDVKNLPAGIDGQNYVFADPEGEGINGILTESANAWYFKPNLGHDNFYKDHPAEYTDEPVGSFDSLRVLNQKPNGASASSLQDIDGDGKPEAVIREPHMAGFYKQKENGEWGEFQYFENHPNLDFQSEDIKFIDLNGDGRADILITKQDTLEWIAYQDDSVFLPKEEQIPGIGYGHTQVISRALDEEQGPRVVFSNGKQNIFLSDMTGDGFSDLVRIENGSICYWPNRGFGRFGAKVVMSNVSTFDYADQFDANRIRLGDIDGSGTTDILYLGAKATSYYINQAGNALADGVELSQFPSKDSLQNVQLADILGNGTSCLVWSSTHEKDKPHHIKYIDLMGGQKPYLLEEMDNGMGALRKFSYAPSTKFYLRDKQAGTPWITKLMFPVHTLERVEVFEQITQSRFVTRYAYHHGHFDPIEKEFRGFGMVEQWDTEHYENFNEPALYKVGSNALEPNSHSEPVYTKSWFHNGYFAQKERIEEQYEKEYWQGDLSAFPARATAFDASINDAEELRQAYRALKGSALRQEVYGLNSLGEKGVPYSVSQSSYKVWKLQDMATNLFGVFRTELQESVSYSYEQDANDPRIGQQFLLESDAFGNPTKSATVAYPRRGSGHEPEQLKGHIVFAENAFINHTPEPVAGILTDSIYRVGVGSTEAAWEYRPQTWVTPVNADTLLTALNTATVIAAENDFTGTTDEKKLITKAKMIYYNEDLSGELAPGSISSHALPHHTERLAFTDDLINDIYNFDATTRIDLSSQADQDLLTEAGYLWQGTEWWIPSGRMVFDASRFYLPIHSIDVFDNQSNLFYDTNDLFPVEMVDPLNNSTKSEINYVHLQPTLLTDPNGNRQQTVLDALGMPVKMLVMGKDTTHPSYYFNEGDTLNDPSILYEYDLFQFQLHQLPNYSKTTQRETHVEDAGANNEVRIDIEYFDGLGKSVQARAQFDVYSGTNGEDTQVVVSGRQVTNNKDLVVEQYEPYFDTGFEYKIPLTDNAAISTSSLGNAIESFVNTNGEAELGNEILLKTYLDSELGTNELIETYYSIAREKEIISHNTEFNWNRGSASNFGGIDFGNHAQHHFGAGDFTAEAWINPNQDDYFGRLVIFSTLKFENNIFSGFQLFIFQNELWLELGEPNGSNYATARAKGIATIPQNTWNHIVANRIGNNPNDWKFYLNGTQISTSLIANQLTTGNIDGTGVANLEIGSCFGRGPNFPFEGKIASAKLYNRSLSESEVIFNFQEGLNAENTETNGLVFWAKLDETNTGSFSDSSTYGEVGSKLGVQLRINFGFNTNWQENSPVPLSRIRLQYDVLGRNIRTDYEDGTFEKVEFDAWEQKNYDRNDTVVDSQWYVDRNSPDLSLSIPADPEERAAYLSAKHYNTPQLIEMDTLGRAFRSRMDNGSFDGSTTTHTYYDVRMAISIEAKQLKVSNALNQDTVFKYNLLPPDKEGNSVMTFTDSSDGGWRILLQDAVGNPIKTWNEREHVSRSEYDQLLRPTKSFVDEGSGEELVAYTVYGDNIDTSIELERFNLRGQAIRVFDQSGVMHFTNYDFKGNNTGIEKYLAFDYQNTVDWSDLASETLLNDIDNLATNLYLEVEDGNRIKYHTRIIFDGMNRIDHTKGYDNKFQCFYYAKSGLLNRVEQGDNFNSLSDYIGNITYNAKGQRTNVYYENNSKTKYEYDSSSFRLTRLLTTRNTGQDILQDLNYTFDAVGNIVEQVDHAQQTLYFSNTIIEPKGKYEYDAVYRLTKATGRERDGLAAPDHSGSAPELLPTNGSSANALRTYCETYEYDDLGNILALRHHDTCGGTENWVRHYNYTTNKPNNYLLSTHASSESAPTTAVYSYDAHGNLQKMTHLSSMTWDFADQLKSTVKTDETTYYVYSGGQRVRKIVMDTSGTPFVKSKRLYLGAAEWYKKYDGAGTLDMERLTHHISDDNGKVASLETKTTDNGAAILPDNRLTVTRYQYSNHLGSACLELNENAEILSYEEFHPFGSTSYALHSNNTEVSLKRYKYNSKERDEETNLDYYGARYYASWLCRFVSVDPKKDDYVFQNSFAYAANSPVTMVDVNGEGPSSSALKSAAKKLGVSVAVIRAIYQVETGGSAFRENGDAKVLFERHYFHRFTDGKYDKSHPKLSNSTYGGYGKYSEQLGKLNKAAKLNKEAAYKSASYGGFQIMGSNYKLAGYDNVTDFAEDMMSKDEDKHLMAFVNFVQSNSKMVEALKDKEWAKFARLYNGPKYEDNDYDTKLKNAYEKFKEETLPDDTSWFSESLDAANQWWNSWNIEGAFDWSINSISSLLNDSSKSTIYEVNTTGNLNFRAGASTDSKIIGSLAPDTKLIATGETEGDWVQVNYAEKTGWVHSKFLRTNENN